MTEQVTNQDALAKYIQLENENKRLLQENQYYYEQILKLRKEWGVLAAKVSSVYRWLETRQDTKTVTIRRKMAETFGWAGMEADFVDMIAKWPCKESREAAIAWLERESSVVPNPKTEAKE